MWIFDPDLLVLWEELDSSLEVVEVVLYVGIVVDLLVEGAEVDVGGVELVGVFVVLHLVGDGLDGTVDDGLVVDEEFDLWTWLSSIEAQA